MAGKRGSGAVVMTLDDYRPPEPRGKDFAGRPRPFSGREERVVDMFGGGDPRELGLTLRQFEDMAKECRDQPEWRTLADKAADYYDHNQFTAEKLKELENRGLPPLARNLVWPTVNLILGIEAKNKKDFKVAGDTDDQTEVAEGLTSMLHQAERETRADNCISNAFAATTKCGVGWVGIAEKQDPFRYWLEVEDIHRREMWWDWYARKWDLSDARYVIRRRWYDIDEVSAWYPDWTPVLRAATESWGDWWLTAIQKQPWLYDASETQRRTSLQELDWLDATRRRVCLYEVSYQTWVRGLVLRKPDDSAVELDRNNPEQMAAIAAGALRPEPATYARWRRSIWAGPHRLADTDRVPNRLRYVPFWGFREDLTGIPYGVVRGMISQQDEINARRQFLMWALGAVRIEMDSDALDLKANSVEEVLDIVAQPDALVQLNPQARGARFKVDRNDRMSEQQFQILQDAQQGLQDVAGVYKQMLGDSGGVTAGIAINQLIDQGTTGLAELFDNHGYGRTRVGEVMVDAIRDRVRGRETPVTVGEWGNKRTIIILNQRVMDPETGVEALRNDTSASTLKVALDETPSTPTYKQQLMLRLGEVLKSLPEQMQAVLAPYYFEMSDFPKRHEMAKELRKVLLGVETADGEEADPEKAQLQQQLQEAMALIEQLQNAPEAKVKEAQANKLRVEAAKIMETSDEEAAKIRAQADLARAQTAEVVARTAEMIHRPPVVVEGEPEGGRKPQASGPAGADRSGLKSPPTTGGRMQDFDADGGSPAAQQDTQQQDGRESADEGSAGAGLAAPAEAPQDFDDQGLRF